jgi:hypothetical protein
MESVDSPVVHVVEPEVDKDNLFHHGLNVCPNLFVTLVCRQESLSEEVKALKVQLGDYDVVMEKVGAK